MTDQEEADNSQVEEETGLPEALDPETEPSFLALCQENAGR